MYESGQGSDPTLDAAFIAFYIVLLCISSTKDKGQRTKDHHNKAVVFINYLFCLLYYKKRLVLKMNSCTAKNTCLFSSTEMSVLPYKITSNVGWQKVENFGIFSSFVIQTVFSNTDRKRFRQKRLKF